MSGCKGCGAALKPSGPKDHRRKWCSERCRKRSYGDPCIDCGARTSYGAEKKRVPEPHCDSCRAQRATNRRVERALKMLEMRRNGATNLEAARRLGVPVGTVATEMYRLHLLGFDFPAAPYNNARFRSMRRYSEAQIDSLARGLIERGVTVPNAALAAAAIAPDDRSGDA